jgi:AraC-like DNA-binding protein
MDFFSMDFFDGINFISYSSNTNHTSFADRVFAGYYGIQFNSYGDFLFSVGEQPLKRYSGAHAFITHPGIRFRYGSPPGEPGRGHNFICFSGSRVKQYIKSGLLPIGTGKAIKLPNGEKFLLAMEDLFSCLESERQEKEKAVNLLEALLLQIYRANISSNEGEPQQKILLLVEAIRRSSKTNWNFEKTARELNISLAHFRRIFKQTTGSAPQHYLNEIRLRTAATLLRETTESIKLIADKSGFKDRFYFSRRFKQQYNLAPAAYRTEFGVKN